MSTNEEPDILTSSENSESEKDSFHLELSEKNTSEDVPTVIEKLLQNTGINLVLDVGRVERIDTAYIEVLIAASKQWKENGDSFKFLNVTEAFEDCLELLGISVSKLEVGEQ